MASGAIQGGSGLRHASSPILQDPARPGYRRSEHGAHEEAARRGRPSGEAGRTDKAFQVRGWICLVGPIGMPDHIVQKLSDVMVEGGKTERIQSPSTRSGS